MCYITRDETGGPKERTLVLTQYRILIYQQKDLGFKRGNFRSLEQLNSAECITAWPLNVFTDLTTIENVVILKQEKGQKVLVCDSKERSRRIYDLIVQTQKNKPRPAK